MKGANTAMIYAYVDSGATYSVFSADDAEKLGIDMEMGEPRYLMTGDGGSILILYCLNIALIYRYNPSCRSFSVPA